MGACRAKSDGGVADIDDEAEMRAVTTASRPGVRLASASVTSIVAAPSKAAAWRHRPCTVTG